MTATVDSFPEFLKPRYRPLQLLKQGGKGVVFKAEDTVIARIVAIKILKPDSSAKDLVRFQQEAKTMSKLKHQNIVAVHDFAVDKSGTPYMIMEFIEGNDLSDVLKGGPPSVKTAVVLLLQVARGMLHAHENGIVHRDLKPSNLIIEDGSDLDSCVRIVDFGLARFAGDALFVTTAGSVVGTPNYLSPEQARGLVNTDDLGFSSDIYSFACILFELLTGACVFTGETAFEVVQQHAEATPPALPDVIEDDEIQERLARVVDKCLRKEPEDRYGSFAELCRELAFVDERFKRIETEQRLLESTGNQSEDKSGPTLFLPKDATNKNSGLLRIALTCGSIFWCACLAWLAYANRDNINHLLFPQKTALNEPLTDANIPTQANDAEGIKKEVQSLKETAGIVYQPPPDFNLEYTWQDYRFDAPTADVLKNRQAEAIGLLEDGEIDPGIISSWSAVGLKALRLRPVRSSRIPEIGELKSLELLWIKPVHLSVENVRTIVELENLKTLILTTNDLTADHTEVLSKATKLENLSVFGFNRLSPEGFSDLARLENLQRLVLQTAEVTDEGLNALLTLKKLESMALPGHGFTDRQGEMIARSKLKRLTIFNLKQATPAVLSALSKSKHLTSITFLNADETKEPALAALRLKMPKCKIERVKFRWNG